MENLNELLEGLFDLNMNNEITLKDLLPEKDYERLLSFFTANMPQIPFSILERQQPMMLASSLYELFLACDKKNGIDLRVIEYASKHKIETKGLETIAFQTSVLDSIPYHEQAKELSKTIDSIDKYKLALNELMNAYKNQDIELLHDLSTSEEAGTANYLDLLLYDRNKRWVQQIEQISKQKSTLYAVGAGHLGGEQGVINLLKKKGYKLRPLVN